MQVGSTGFATLAYLGHALSAERSGMDSAKAAAAAASGPEERLEAQADLTQHAATYAALGRALRAQDAMLGSLLDMVSEPWRDTPQEHRDRLRRAAGRDRGLRETLAVLGSA